MPFHIAPFVCVCWSASVCEYFFFLSFFFYFFLTSCPEAESDIAINEWCSCSGRLRRRRTLWASAEFHPVRREYFEIKEKVHHTYLPPPSFFLPFFFSVNRTNVGFLGQSSTWLYLGFYVTKGNKAWLWCWRNSVVSKVFITPKNLRTHGTHKVNVFTVYLCVDFDWSVLTHQCTWSVRLWTSWWLSVALGQIFLCNQGKIIADTSGKC